jgi:hypothetical protein
VRKRMVRLPYVTALTTLFSYGLLFAFGQLRDFFRGILNARNPSNLKVRRRPRLAPARDLRICLAGSHAAVCC